jgi:hypothetical protein
VAVPGAKEGVRPGQRHEAGAFVVQDGSSTVLRALALAEGYTPYSSARRRFIYAAEGGATS